MNDDRRTLVELSRGWMQAIATNDAAAIGGYMAEDWVLVTPQAGPVQKADFLGAIARGDLVHDSMEVEGEEHVQLFDNGAVLVSRVQNHGRYLGESFSYDEWSTDTYVRTNDGWRCVITALTPAFESQAAEG
jgi:ketosteroid isomerase-like protein